MAASMAVDSSSDPPGSGGLWATKSKNDQAKKIEILKELHQLEIKEQNLDKEKATHVYSKRSDFRKEFLALEEMDQKKVTERKTEKVRLQQQLNKIRNMVAKFHRELKDVRPTPEFVEKLKVIMEDIEQNINQFKESQREKFDDLLKDERIVSQELTALEKRFETWNQIQPLEIDPPRSARPKPPTSARDVLKDLPPEVAALEKFLQQTGGIKGGWDEYDHQTFMKFRNRHKGKATFLREAIASLPTKTDTEVIDHEKWYQEYLDLNEIKKVAIQRWREKKEDEKEGLLTQAERNQQKKEEEQQRKEEEKRRLMEREKGERFSKLNAWKVQKELEKAREDELRLKEHLQKAKQKEKEEQRKAEAKAQLEEYQRQKEDEEEMKRLEEDARLEMEEEEKRQMVQRNAARIKEKNKKIITEKKAKRNEKFMEEIEKEKRLQKMRGKVVQAPRDPSRLYQPTEGTEARKRDTASSGGQVYHLQHRAVPTWRQGVH
ncbi:coiled-coil domain-containing protein 112-like [Lineus longissimus]|uniref:coiled-coil domain-containing protein 112-like n=1 Tax=Lineus longissimus TaxID=88925 RepID=UPI002B4F21A8